MKIRHKLLFALNDIIKQLSTLHVLHDKKKLFGGLDYLVQLDYAWVADQFQDMDLSTDSLDIGYIDHFLFLKDFYSYFLAG